MAHRPLTARPKPEDFLTLLLLSATGTLHSHIKLPRLVGMPHRTATPAMACMRDLLRPRMDQDTVGAAPKTRLLLRFLNSIPMLLRTSEPQGLEWVDRMEDRGRMEDRRVMVVLMIIVLQLDLPTLITPSRVLVGIRMMKDWASLPIFFVVYHFKSLKMRIHMRPSFFSFVAAISQTSSPFRRQFSKTIIVLVLLCFLDETFC